MATHAESHLPPVSGETTEQRKDALLRQVDDALHAEKRSHLSGLAGVYELKWLAVICMALMVPIFAGPYVLASNHATLVCYYGAIIAFVISGWGLVRAFVSARHAKSIYRFVAMLYAGFFVFLLLLFGTLLQSQTLDKRWIFIWSVPAKAPPGTNKK